MEPIKSFDMACITNTIKPYAADTRQMAALAQAQDFKMDPEHSNPAGLQNGDVCYGVYVPAFSPYRLDLAVPDSMEIIKGKLTSDYACQPAGQDERSLPPCYFMPDEPLDGTKLDSGFYRLENWIVSPNIPDAVTVRAKLATAAIYYKKGEIQILAKFC